jgi:hypothetical protein
MLFSSGLIPIHDKPLMKKTFIRATASSLLKNVIKEINDYIKIDMISCSDSNLDLIRAKSYKNLLKNDKIEYYRKAIIINAILNEESKLKLKIRAALSVKDFNEINRGVD